MIKHKWLLVVILAYCLIGCLGMLTGIKTVDSAPTDTPIPNHHLYLPPDMKNRASQYRDGDWIITGVETVEDTTITLDGNLIVEEGGSLTLRNVVLLMEQKPQDMYQILAKQASNLVITDSTITPLQEDYRFAFIVQGADFVLKGSKLEGLGQPSEYETSGGLLIYDTNGTSLEGNTINHHESYGITLRNSTNTTITNNTITCTGPDETSGAINLDNSHYSSITYNHLYRQWNAVYLQRSWDNYIAYNELTLTDHTIGISLWDASGNNIIAYNNISAHEGYDMA